MLRKLLILFSVLLVTAVYFGCSNRGDTIVTTESPRAEGIFKVAHEFFDQLGFCMFTEIRYDPKLPCLVYTPNGYNNTNEGRPYPVLFLLTPYGETEEYYFNHGLRDVADRLIASGEIEPMIIVCINGRNGYGGTFYGDNYAGGRFTQLIGDVENDIPTGTLIDYIDGTFNTLCDGRHGAGTGRSNRAISGVGMGGYGAMKIAITYDENFGSVSAIAAPLDFDGANGNSGIIEYFDDAVADLDTTSISLDSAYQIMDTSYSKPLRTMLFAMAASFSPHDIDYTDRRFYLPDPMNPNAPVGWHALDTIRIEDTVTYFMPKGKTSPLKFHLPFDKHGAKYDPIWTYWQQNNVTEILTNSPGSLDSTAVLLMTTVDASYNFNQQTLDFSNYLSGLSIPHYFDTTFIGYDGKSYNTFGDRFLYDMLPDILKFHSDNFIVP